MLVALCGVAGAEPTRRVEVITDPPGATIYLGDLDSGVACQPTPCKVNAPAGKKTSIIARMDGYSEAFGVIDLRHGDVRRVTLDPLTPTTATLVVEDPGFAGGDVRIDDVDKGKAPTRIPLAPEGHHVVVVANGKTLYDDFITPAPQEEFTIKPKPVGVGQAGEPATHNEDENPVDGSSEPPANVTKPVDLGGGSPEPRFSIGLAFEVGFRQFSYKNPNGLPPTENEGGQVLLGPAIQIWPARFFHARHLRGLSLYGKYGYGANARPVLQAPNNMPTGATTFWQNIEIDLLQRWNIGERAAVEIGGGYVRDQLEFNANLTSQLAGTPFVNYQGLRIGARGVLRFGALEPYLQVETRIPFTENDGSTGSIEPMFQKASVTGGGGALGLAMNFHYIQAKLEASIIVYSWSITNAPGATPSADGARDVIEGITAFIGGGF